MRVYFVRHSQVQKEYQGKYNGHIDISLSKKGRDDAKELAKKLKDIKFDIAFCSDLRRAKETLFEFSLDCDVIFSSELREKSWGRHEGKSFDEIQKEGIVYTTFEKWIEDLDGERFKDYTKRVESYFKNVILSQKAKNILVVTHAGVIKTLILKEKKMSLDETFAIDLPYSGYIIYDSQKGFMV
jgi:broad specificity phosphatase PhoE